MIINNHFFIFIDLIFTLKKKIKKAINVKLGIKKEDGFVP